MKIYTNDVYFVFIRIFGKAAVATAMTTNIESTKRLYDSILGTSGLLIFKANGMTKEEYLKLSDKFNNPSRTLEYFKQNKELVHSEGDWEFLK